MVSVPASVVAAAVSLLAGWIMPLESPAELLIQWTPVPIANLLLAHLAWLARPAALLGGLAVVMLLSGIGGALFLLPGSGVTGRLLGACLAGAFLAISLLHIVPASSVESTGVLVVLLMGGLLLQTIGASDHPQQRVAGLDREPQGGPALGRRSFLVRSGVVLLGAAVVLAEYSLQPLLGKLSTYRLFPFRKPQGLAIQGITELVTPSQSFYVMDKVLQYPEIDRVGWRLRVEGDVRRPLVLTLDDLMARASVSRYITMECVDNPVGGPLIGNALWTGIPVSQLLYEAGARGTALTLSAIDQYGASVPRELAENAGGLIAFGMNGQTLSRAHGYPARFLLPGSYGFKSVKWLTRIEVTDRAAAGNWTAQGWSEEGRIHTMTRIDVARRQGSRLVLAGVAFAGNRGIRAVEARVNGGPWLHATLGPSLSRDSWVQWAVQLVGPPPARVEVRAVDGEGHVQERARHSAYPSGATGWPSVTL